MLGVCCCYITEQQSGYAIDAEYFLRLEQEYRFGIGFIGYDSCSSAAILLLYFFLTVTEVGLWEWQYVVYKQPVMSQLTN